MFDLQFHNRFGIRFLLMGALLVMAMSLLSQTYSEAELEAVNSKRLKINQKSMYVLGGWAVTNIAAGLYFRGKTTGVNRYFHEGNAGWNVVNLAIAGGSLWAGAHTDPASYDLWQTIAEQQKIEKILLFNAGLDLGYMATGLYLRERSRRFSGTKADRLNGYGKALLVQGRFFAGL
ncbi:MAG: hypothetical protein R3B47_09645 [Bacteroidia bacterium]